jgi:hypothetical protein
MTFVLEFELGFGFGWPVQAIACGGPDGEESVSDIDDNDRPPPGKVADVNAKSRWPSQFLGLCHEELLMASRGIV